jgi:hypothetical protein
MSACSLLVFLLQRFGYAVKDLWIAVLVGTLFHTFMSLEGLRSSSVGIIYLTNNGALRKKVELLAGAFGGFADVLLLLLIIAIWQWLDVGRVVTFIFFISGFLLPPAFGAVVGFRLARKIVGNK